MEELGACRKHISRSTSCICVYYSKELNLVINVELLIKDDIDDGDFCRYHLFEYCKWLKDVESRHARRFSEFAINFEVEVGYNLGKGVTGSGTSHMYAGGITKLIWYVRESLLHSDISGLDMSSFVLSNLNGKLSSYKQAYLWTYHGNSHDLVINISTENQEYIKDLLQESPSPNNTDNKGGTNGDIAKESYIFSSNALLPKSRRKDLESH